MDFCRVEHGVTEKKVVLEDNERAKPSDKHKIHLTGEKETLLIPLYAKALDSRSKNSILHDRKADEIVRSIDYDFGKFQESFGHGNIMVVRARQLDEWVKEFLKLNPEANVLNLGCGLDTRVSRLSPASSVRWFDVDFPEVIEERQKFFSDAAGYQMVASSITDKEWLEKVPNDKPTFVVADGVFEYLAQDEVKVLVNRVTSHFPRGQVAFDVMSTYALKMGKADLKEKTGAEHKWSVDEVGRVDELDPKLRRLANTSVLRLKFFPLKYRLVFGIASAVPRFRNMIRLLRYEF